MHCSNCGQELKEGDKFCPSCGQACELPDGEAAPGAEDLASRPTESAQASANVQPQPAQTSQDEANFKAAVSSSSKHARRRVPILVLVAFITMLVAGVAYATYYVYTTIIAPAQVEEVEEEAEEEPVTIEPAAEVEPADDGIPEATGNPTSIFELSELMAMDPSQMQDFIESQGGVNKSTLRQFESYGDCSGWQLMSADLSALGQFRDPDWNYGEISFETNFGFYHDVGQGYKVSPSTVRAGQRPAAIQIQEGPITGINDDTIEAFADTLKLGTVASSAKSGSILAYTGYFKIDQEIYYWGICQVDNNNILFVCCNEAAALGRTINNAESKEVSPSGKTPQDIAQHLANSLVEDCKYI